MQKDYHEKSMKAKSIFTTNVLPGKHSVFVFDPVANKYYYKIVIIEMKIATEHQKYWIQKQKPVEMITEKRAVLEEMNPCSFLQDIRPDILNMSSLN